MYSTSTDNGLYFLDMMYSSFKQEYSTKGVGVGGNARHHLSDKPDEQNCIVLKIGDETLIFCVHEVCESVGPVPVQYFDHIGLLSMIPDFTSTGDKINMYLLVTSRHCTFTIHGRLLNCEFVLFSR